MSNSKIWKIDCRGSHTRVFEKLLARSFCESNLLLFTLYTHSRPLYIFTNLILLRDILHISMWCKKRKQLYEICSWRSLTLMIVEFVGQTYEGLGKRLSAINAIKLCIHIIIILTFWKLHYFHVVPLFHVPCWPMSWIFSQKKLSENII